MEPTARSRSLALYFTLTTLLAWSWWIAVSRIPAPDGARALLFLPGTFAPSIAALWMTARAEGKAGVLALVGRIAVWQVGARWYLFAVGYMAAVKLAAALAHRALAGAWPPFGEVPPHLMLLAVVFSTPFQAGEEIGWRGYALPRLAERIGIARGSVLLGAIWALWHLPLFYIPGTSTSGQSFVPYFLSVTALSVAMAWLWANTGRSLLLVMLMHAAINNTKDIVPSAGPASEGVTMIAWITSAFLWAGAACFLILMSRSRAVERLERSASPLPNQ